MDASLCAVRQNLEILCYMFLNAFFSIFVLQVAVAGLPNPQEDHAVRMVKFAEDCMAKMSLLVRELSETLGEDTADLQLRIGLHSGPVTAGVLRGQRCRFQLFGDTGASTLYSYLLVRLFLVFSQHSR